MKPADQPLLRSQSLLALKVCTSERSTQEVEVAHHLQSLDPGLEGLQCLRISLDDFEVSNPSGKHAAMVFNPLDLTWSRIRKQYEGGSVPRNQVQMGLWLLLHGLDILHQAGIAHTGTNTSISFAAFVTLKTNASSKTSTLTTQCSPSATNQPGLESRNKKKKPPPLGKSSPIAPYTIRGRVMPDFYRAPEVVLGMEWDCKVDMWFVGLMVRYREFS